MPDIKTSEIVFIVFMTVLTIGIAIGAGYLFLRQYKREKMLATTETDNTDPKISSPE